MHFYSLQNQFNSSGIALFKSDRLPLHVLLDILLASNQCEVLTKALQKADRKTWDRDIGVLASRQPVGSNFRGFEEKKMAESDG